MILTRNRWLPVILWMVVIFTFSSLPIIKAPEKSILDFLIKKTAHIGEYTILFVIFTRALPKKNRFTRAFIYSLVFAFTDEIHQLLTPGRTGTLIDVVIFDMLGLSLGWFLLTKTRLKKLIP